MTKITFKQFLRNQTKNIKIKSLCKTIGTYETYAEQVDRTSYNNEIINKKKIIDKQAYFYSKVKYYKNISLNDENMKYSSINIPSSNYLSIDNLHTLFNDFCKLGKDLYLNTKDNFIKFNKSYNYEVYDLSVYSGLSIANNRYNDRVRSIIRIWLENNDIYSSKEDNNQINEISLIGHFCLEEDKDLDVNHFIETDCLIELSILSYLIRTSIKGYLHGFDSSTNPDRKRKNTEITFSDYIQFYDKIDVNDFDYLRAIPRIISVFEESKGKYIGEHTELQISNEVSIGVKMFHVYDNLYSILLYILKLYIEFSFTQAGFGYRLNCCSMCGKYFDGYADKCDSCTKAFNSSRKQLLRDNARNKEKIKELLKNNSDIDSSLLNQINDVLSRKPSYKDYDEILNVLNMLTDKIMTQ